METEYQITVCALIIIIVILFIALSVTYNNLKFWKEQAIEKSSMVDYQCVKILKMKVGNQGLIKAMIFKRKQITMLKELNLLLLKWIKEGIEVSDTLLVEDKEEIKCGE